MKHCLEFARRARWIITIGMLWLAGASVAVAAPFDIVSSQKDQNGALLNPVWEWQLTHPDQLPDNSAGQICQGHSWESPCTSQPIDANDPILGDPYCEGGQGHRNWGVATFTGVAFWDEHSDDDDYNIDLYRPDHGGLTVDSTLRMWFASVYPLEALTSEPVLHMEFNAGETIDKFQTSWWQSFQQLVDKPDSSAYNAISGKDVIAIGIFNQDIKHTGNTAGVSELHPLLGLAIHLAGSESDDQWAFFVRNYGTEGPCSHYAKTWPVTQMTFFLPRLFATNATIPLKEIAWVSTSGTPSADEIARLSTVAVTTVKNQGALVTFNLLPPERGVSLNGIFHIGWTIQRPVWANPGEVEASKAQLFQYKLQHQKVQNCALPGESCLSSGIVGRIRTGNSPAMPNPPPPAPVLSIEQRSGP
jgi:hypothetical protein